MNWKAKTNIAISVDERASTTSECIFLHDSHVQSSSCQACSKSSAPDTCADNDDRHARLPTRCVRRLEVHANGFALAHSATATIL